MPLKSCSPTGTPTWQFIFDVLHRSPVSPALESVSINFTQARSKRGLGILRDPAQLTKCFLQLFARSCPQYQMFLLSKDYGKPSSSSTVRTCHKHLMTRKMQTKPESKQKCAEFEPEPYSVRLRFHECNCDENSPGSVLLTGARSLRAILPGFQVPSSSR